MAIQHSIPFSYYHQSNGQVEACIKFVKCTTRNFLDTNQNICLALLQIWPMSAVVRLPSPATMLYNRLVRGLLLQMNRKL